MACVSCLLDGADTHAEPPATMTAADRSDQNRVSDPVQAEPAQPAEIRIDPLDPYKTFSPEQVLRDWPVYAVCPAAQERSCVLKPVPCVYHDVR